ncbi:norsolorinic acid reductase [Lasiosphaeria miniovina]|uniref:Norsolorinic acid reductase n=1 Tax=Lasiosphaeria miniovina TaxID=1954250 RepID=A0AA40E044_9PEZI|nr:norsolorinic acid reductase [Lasiosphaeria miniovina]KAK0722090.1 norsolorinic acid reductase [Lasiosphaeria miniovina]
MSVLPMAPPPKGPLNRYRLLSPTASVRVSPLCLGAMNFGNAWKGYMGECDQKTTEEILDFFYESGGMATRNPIPCSSPLSCLCWDWGGNLTSACFYYLGNFIDTANNYQSGESETWIGEWMKKRGNRDQMVIATKFTTEFKSAHAGKEIIVNFAGNSTKSLRVSVESSLKRLQTSYIDLLYVHWWDFSTTIPELMQSLNGLVTSGKVLYLGISDTPAWVVSKANQYARDHNMRQFSVYQGRWSAANRDFERDIIPMSRDEGMALAPWGALGGGAFKTEEQRQQAREGRNIEHSEREISVSKALEAVAKRKQTIITSVALAYVMHKTPYVFPIVGGRNTRHLKGNIEALTLRLTADDIAEIDAAAPFDIGFPNTFLYGEAMTGHPNEMWLAGMAGTQDFVPLPKPITPAE